ncbi:hypothetical protein PG985_004243 [Apiospora marii]|uniref:Uncharacterized protein n=1 Tax=Apiospora marii TaxID=335849 RepID=A0ABR1SAX5_9PEZI
METKVLVRLLRRHALPGVDEPQAGPLPPEDAQLALGRGGEGRGLLLRLQGAARRVEVRYLPDRLRPQEVAAAAAAAVRGGWGARAARPDPEVGDGGRDRRRGLVRGVQEEGVGGRGQAGYEGEGEAGVVVDRWPQALVGLVPAAAALLARPHVGVDGVVALGPAAHVLDLRRDDDAGAVGREARGLEPDRSALGQVGDGEHLYPVLIRALVAKQQDPTAEPHGDVAVVWGHGQAQRLLGRRRFVVERVQAGVLLQPTRVEDHQG